MGKVMVMPSASNTLPGRISSSNSYRALLRPLLRCAWSHTALTGSPQHSSLIPPLNPLINPTPGDGGSSLTLPSEP
jgi:hypothetical protein